MKAAFAITMFQWRSCASALRGSFDLRITSTAARTCFMRGSSKTRLAVNRCVTRGEQKKIPLSQRYVERVRQLQQYFTAGLCSTGLQES